MKGVGAVIFLALVAFVCGVDVSLNNCGSVNTPTCDLSDLLAANGNSGVNQPNLAVNLVGGVSGKLYTIQIANTYSYSSLTLPSSPATVQLSINSGGLTLGGALTVGAGTVNVASGARLTAASSSISGTVTTLGTASFGTVTLSGTGVLTVSSGSSSASSLTLPALSKLAVSGGTLTVSGAISQSTGSQITVAGTLVSQTTSTVTINGDFVISGAGAARFAGAVTFPSPGGNFYFSGTSANTKAVLNVAGVLTFNNFPSPNTIFTTITAASVTVSGFTLIGDSATTLTTTSGDATGTFNVLGGLTIAGTLFVTGSSTFTGSNSVNKLSVASGQTATIAAGSSLSIASDTTLTGSLDTSAAGATVSFGGALTVSTNLNTAASSIGGNLVISGGTTTFSRQVTIAGSVTVPQLLSFPAGAIINGAVSVSGAISFGGSSQLKNGLTSTAQATVTVVQGATVAVTGAVTSLSGTINNAGTLTSAQAVTVAGTLTNNAGRLSSNGAITVSGTVNNNNAASLTSTGAVSVSGTVNNNAGGTFSGQAASVTGTGTIANSGGTLSFAGVNVASGASIQNSNSATATFSSGLTSAGSISNDATSQITVTGDTAVAAVSNSGIFLVNGGASLGAAFTNGGQFNVTGAVKITGSYTTSRNSITSLASSVTGTGALSLLFGTHILSGITNYTGQINVDNLAIVSFADSTIQNLKSGTSSIYLSSTSVSLSSASSNGVPASFYLNGNSAISTSVSNTVQNVVVTGTANALTATGGALLTVNGDLTVAANAVLNVAGSFKAFTVVNSGTINLASGNSITFGGATSPFTNNGILNVNNGAVVDIQGTFQNNKNAAVTAASGANVKFGYPVMSAGALNFASGSVISITNTFSSTGTSSYSGAVTFSNPLNFTAPFIVPTGGSVTVTGLTVFGEVATIGGSLAVANRGQAIFSEGAQIAGTLVLGQDSSATFNNAASSIGTLAITQAQVVFNAGTNAAPNTIGSVIVASTSGISGPFISITTLTLSPNTNAVLALGGAITVSGATNIYGNLAIKNNAAVTFAGVTAGGATSIILSAGSSVAITASSVINSSLALDAAQLSLSSGTYIFGSTITSGSGSAITFGANTIVTVVGAMNVNGAFNIRGNSATFQSEILVSGGTFSIQSNAVVSFAVFILANGASFSVSPGSSVITFNGNVNANAATFTTGAGSTVTFYGAVITTATMSIAGTLVLSADKAAASFSGGISAAASSTVNINRNTGLTLTRNSSFAGVFSIGTGTGLTLSNNVSAIFNNGITTTSTVLLNIGSSLNFGNNTYITTGQATLLEGSSITANTVFVSGNQYSANNTQNFGYLRYKTASIVGNLVVNSSITSLGNLVVTGNLIFSNGSYWILLLTSAANTLTISGSVDVSGVYALITYPNAARSESFSILYSPQNRITGQLNNYGVTNPAGQSTVTTTSAQVTVAYVANPTEPPTLPPVPTPAPTTPANSSPALVLSLFNFVLALLCMM